MAGLVSSTPHAGSGWVKSKIIRTIPAMNPAIIAQNAPWKVLNTIVD